jgi:F-type H+-transporting ATPase subunit a
VGNHFTWFEFFHVSEQNVPIAASLLCTVLIILFSVAGRLALGSGEAAIEPAPGLSIKGFFEAFTEFMDDLVRKILGHHGREFLPVFGSIFFYVLFSNLFGLIPGMEASTSDINCTFAIGIFSFVLYNFIGFRHAGPGYVKHFLGPVWWMAPLLLPIELISNFVRPVSLGIRLKVNMLADHTILGTFITLTKIGIPVIFYGMGTFVCLVQAFVFTMLSMVYVMMVTADDH